MIETSHQPGDAAAANSPLEAQQVKKVYTTPVLTCLGKLKDIVQNSLPAGSGDLFGDTFGSVRTS